MFWVDFLGYAASASVVATFCMSTIVPLRTVAICSNVLFAAFGALAHVYPVLVLHTILLPVNVVRLLQVFRGVEGPRQAILPWALWFAVNPSAKPMVRENWRKAKGFFDDWRQRVRSRHDLMTLDSRDLCDMHLTRCDALHDRRNAHLARGK